LSRKAAGSEGVRKAIGIKKDGVRRHKAVRFSLGKQKTVRRMMYEGSRQWEGWFKKAADRKKASLGRQQAVRRIV
jgi:hypothetical protein